MYVLVCEVQGKHRIEYEVNNKCVRKIKKCNFTKAETFVFNIPKHIQIKNVPQFRYTRYFLKKEKKKEN